MLCVQYMLEIKIVNNSSVKRLELIESVGGLISPCHVVDLKKPRVVIFVLVLQVFLFTLCL